MARTWLRIQVDLLGGRGHRLDPTPGRVFIVGPGQTFEQFADAINSAFARWDRAHLHEFELPDGRKIGYPDDEYAPDLVWLDHAKLRVMREVKPGDEFAYVFDFGDGWQHRCVVAPNKADPVEEYGIVPGPVATGGGAGFSISTAAGQNTAMTRTARSGERPQGKLSTGWQSTHRRCRNAWWLSGCFSYRVGSRRRCTVWRLRAR